MAIALVVWGARTDRRWTVPVASMLALPALWYGGISMLLAVIPLLPERSSRDQAALTGTVSATVIPLVTSPVIVPELVDAVVLAEDVVVLERDLAHRPDARLIPGRGVDEIAGVLRQRNLGRRDLVRLIRGCLEVGVDLEVDVRPATLVARGEDALERHHPRAVGRLDAAQVVLVRGGLRVERVVAGLVAVPEIDRRALERRAAVGGVLDRELDRERDAGRLRRRGPEARGDVLANDAALVQDIRTVGAVSGIRAGRLLRNDGAIGGGRSGRPGGGAGTGPARCTGR